MQAEAPSYPGYVSRRSLFGAFVLVNLLVKGLGLLTNELSHDEPFSFFYAQLPPAEIIKELGKGNNPPFYELFMHAWMWLTGTELWTLRLPSLLCAAFIPSLWLGIVHRLFQRFTPAVIMAVLLTFSNWMLMFSHEMRAYAMALFLASLCIYGVARYPDRLLHLLLSAFAGALAFHTHYLAACMLIVAFPVLVLTAQRRMYSMVIFGMALPVFCMPALVLVLLRLGDPGNTLWGNSPVWTQLYGNINLSLNGTMWICLGLMLLSLLHGEVRLSVRELRYELFGGRLAGFLLGLFFTCYLGFFFLSFIRPVFTERYLVFIFFPFWMAIAWFWWRLYFIRRRTRIWGVILLLVFACGAKLFRSNGYSPAAVAAQNSAFVSENPDSRLVVVYPGWYRFGLAYYTGKDLRSLRPDDVKGAMLSRYRVLTADSPEEVQDLIARDSVSALLYVDAGEEFAFGDRKMYTMLSGLYRSTTVSRPDSQVVITRMGK